MRHDPTSVLKEWPLYPEGVFQIGQSTHSGMHVGLDPLMGRLLIPDSCGRYPSEWFALKDRSRWQIDKLLEGQSVKTLDQSTNQTVERYFLPDSILIDCLHEAWERLYYLSRTATKENP